MSEPQADTTKRAYVCAFCSSVGLSMRYCSGCKTTMYCSRACQKKDWQRHQVTCGQAQPTSDATLPPSDDKTASTASPASTASSNPSTSTTTATKPTSTPSKPNPDEPTQTITFNGTDTENVEVSPGWFTTSNMILAGAATLGVAVATWFTYSYMFASESKPQRPAPRGRQPPQKRR